MNAAVPWFWDIDDARAAKRTVRRDLKRFERSAVQLTADRHDEAVIACALAHVREAARLIGCAERRIARGG